MLKTRLLSLFGIGLAAICGCSAVDDSASTEQADSLACATPVVAGQSLFVAPVVSTYDAHGNVTNTPNAFGTAALANFSFRSVMEQIVTSGGVDVSGGAQPAALALYQQLLGTLGAPACTGTINGFPVDCPSESAGATTNPFTPKNLMVPIALVNRFDLAPNNGANCGQYRVVYAISSPTFAARFLMIFEAVLPNPAPARGLAACLPVAQLWDSLSAPGITPATFASKLKKFYFDGIPASAATGGVAFLPVIQAQHYGIGAPANTNTGQIRVNMLSDIAGPGAVPLGDWELREFRLSQECPAGGGACTLTANNTFVANNPFAGLFANVKNGGSAAFQKELLTQVKSLAAATIPLISMTTPNADNGGESDESDRFQNNNYLVAVTTAPKNTSLLSSIDAELKTLGSPLTAENIIDRATTQSCAGCHQLSPGTNLGPASAPLVWPASNGFTQVDEIQGPGQQSPALAKSFLPFRSRVLTSFINRQCAAPTEADGDGTLTVGGVTTSSAN